MYTKNAYRCTQRTEPTFIYHLGQTWFTSYVTVGLLIILIDFNRTINRLKARD